MTKNRYQEHGAKDRTEYLRNLANDYGVPLGVVLSLSDALGGENEDFDGLVTELEYYADMYEDGDY